ncbi:MAG TPA: HEAT repeat domain-containing protein, partial [Roseiflexaceae bacterium]|nr:HEAT repeat domain-containing protein [Roseiflexaceae bacterium]
YKAIKILTRFLSYDNNINILAANALSNHKSPKIFQIFMELLKSSNDNTRYSAIYGLGLIGDYRAYNHLMSLINNEEEQYADHIANSIASITRKQKPSIFNELHNEERVELRRAFIRASLGRRDYIDHQLLSYDLDAFEPWLDPRDPITEERVEQAAKALDLTCAEVRARYETLAAKLPLRLAWKAG